LKTPIANIAVASEAIRSKDIQLDNVKLKKYADIIHHENIRLHHLVDRVLQISAIEKKEASLVFETCNLHEMIHAIAFNFTAMVQ
jgi:signal transduction histidine kinase